MMKPTTVKFGVSNSALFTAGKTICEFNDAKTAEEVHDFMVKMYCDAIKRGTSDAMIIGGVMLIATGAILKSLWYFKSI